MGLFHDNDSAHTKNSAKDVIIPLVGKLPNSLYWQGLLHQTTFRSIASTICSPRIKFLSSCKLMALLLDQCKETDSFWDAYVFIIYQGHEVKLYFVLRSIFQIKSSVPPQNNALSLIQNQHSIIIHLNTPSTYGYLTQTRSRTFSEPCMLLHETLHKNGKWSGKLRH